MAEPPPLTPEALKGKVVVVDFWTYSCINCQRSIPYVRAWAEKYKDQGLVVIGVHTPEFAFEKKYRQREKGGGIVYRFHARDIQLVLGSAGKGNPVRFRVTIDGAPPGDSHGADVDADGQGVVTGQRLYQLVRQNGAITHHTFEIRFLDPGAAGLRLHLRVIAV